MSTKKWENNISQIVHLNVPEDSVELGKEYSCTHACTWTHMHMCIHTRTHTEKVQGTAMADHVRKHRTHTIRADSVQLVHHRDSCMFSSLLGACFH